MKNSGIGGQAVMEGVMMRNKNKYAVACRKPDGEIVIDIKETHSISEKIKFLAWPFIRGTVNLIESMVIGIKTLTYSADFIEDDTDKAKKAEASKKVASANATPASEAQAETEPAVEKSTDNAAKEEPKQESMSSFMIFCTVALSLVLTIGLFFFLPVLATEGIKALTGIDNPVFTSVIEGIVRMAIFIGYVGGISLMPDIQRVYRYHGAEHKTINCIEHGLPLTVANARASSKEHKRCGTSFMILVMIISILVFSVVNCFTIYSGDSGIVKVLVRFGVRILLLPFVAGISYEFLKLAGRSNNKLVDILSRPGMWMQALTTKEPDDSMLECAIASVEAVFDWQAFIDGVKDDDVSGSLEAGDKSTEECKGSGCGI